MSDSILPLPAYRVTPPAARLEVPREPQLRLIDERGDRVALLVAGGGYGKTTLLRQWAERSSAPVAWLTLDESDNDPLVLMSGVLTALHSAGLAVNWGAVPFTSDEPVWRRWVRPHFERLLESVAARVRLVLDDVGTVTDPAAAQVLMAVVRCLGPGHVLMAGRSARQLPLAEWLGRDEVLLIGADQLAFDHAEIRSALALRHLPVDDDQAGIVLACTAGWPLAVGLHRGDASTGPLLDETLLADFLEDQVLAALPPPTRTMLRRSSVTADLCGELCDAIAGCSGCGEMLAEAAGRSGLIARSGDAGWFRLHPLLREHLVRGLAAAEPAAVSEGHARAAVWFQEHGDEFRALQHALRGEDPLLAGRLLWPFASRSLLSGQSQHARAWLAQVNDRWFHESPELALVAAYVAFGAGDGAAVANWTLITEHLLGPDWLDRLGTSPTIAAFAQLVALRTADAELSRAALAALSPTDAEWPFVATMTGWFATLAGDDAPGAAELLRQGQQVAQVRGFRSHQVGNLALRAVVALADGDLDEAIALVTAAREIRADPRCLPSMASQIFFLPVAAYIAALTDEPGHAATDLAEGLACIEPLVPAAPWFADYAYPLFAAATALIGDQDRAMALLGRRTADDTAALFGGLWDLARQTLDAQSGMNSLSRAERRVWPRLATRMTVREIADELQVSPETVKSHVASIYRKLGITSRREAHDLAERMRPDTRS